MSHVVVRNHLIPDTFGPDYESPISRTFGLNGTMLHSSPRPHSRLGAGLPKWLNFKATKNGTQQNQKPEVHASTKVDKLETRITKNTCQENFHRPKSLTSSNGLRRKVEEHELNTKTEQWKKHRTYESVRERRQLRTKQMNRKLRIARRFYIPSVLFIILGVTSVFCATIRSLGEGTMFWTFKEQFTMIGLIVTIAGVVFLLVTVGVENRIAQEMEKKNIFETDPFIHPDFLKEPNRFNRQISTQSSVCSSDM